MSSIIFDFDGTIADSFDYVVSFLARQSKRPHPLSEPDKHSLRGMSMHAMARQLDLPWWHWPGLFVQGRRAMGVVVSEIEPCEGLPQAIRRLHAGGHHLFIVSSNSVRNIELFLTHHGLETEFIKIYGNVGWRGKAHVLRKACRHNGLKKADTFYVGDEVRDVKSAHRAGIKSVAVGWGYNDAGLLEQHKPYKIVRNPQQLLELFS